MKKILVVLLMLAVAGGVFAQQGEWSLSGGVEIGTRANFDPNPDVDPQEDPATVGAITHNFGWDQIHGNLGLNYTRGIATINLGLNSKIDNQLGLSINGDNFTGKFELNSLLGTIGGSQTANNFTDDGTWAGFNWWNQVSRLWGDYKFVDGMIVLEAAYNSQDTEYWASDKTGTFNDKYSWKWVGDHEVFDFGNTWSKVDHHNFLRVAANIGGNLDFGLMVYDLFWVSGGYLVKGPDAEGNPDGALRKLLFGVKFSQSPFEFAAQFKVANYSFYFGGKFFAGPITVGLSAQGVLDGDGNAQGADADPQHIKIGGQVAYDGSGFGGGLKAFYDRDEIPYVNTDFYLSAIGVEPYFFYDAIPTHLRFKLDVGFYFLNETDGTNSEKANIWAIQPALFWNFLGTGATDSYWGGFDTGIMIKYRLANADVRDLKRGSLGWNASANFLDVVFKWSL